MFRLVAAAAEVVVPAGRDYDGDESDEKSGDRDRERRMEERTRACSRSYSINSFAINEKQIHTGNRASPSHRLEPSCRQAAVSLTRIVISRSC